ncbi:MAG: hypothetical protein ABJN22_12640 [Litorimonas sp.]
MFNLRSRKMRISFLLFAVFSLVFAVISSTLSFSVRLRGAITPEFNAKLQMIDEKEVVKLSSTGGDPDFAEIAANIIQNKKLSLVVEGLCLSSCVEYLLPAADSLQLSKHSVLGVHQNPMMINEFKNSNASYKDEALCYFEDNLDNYARLQASKGIGFQLDIAVAETISKLELEALRLIEKEGCIEVGFRFKNQFWLPDSTQLRTVFGLNFTGEVCADSFAHCSRILDKIFPPDFQIIIANSEYITK